MPRILTSSAPRRATTCIVHSKYRTLGGEDLAGYSRIVLLTHPMGLLVRRPGMGTRHNCLQGALRWCLLATTGTDGVRVRAMGPGANYGVIRSPMGLAPRGVSV
jgi:hypothetical protein